MKPVLLPLLAALACAGLVPGVAAQESPSKPVRIVVAYAPGGAVDLTARLMQPRLSEALGAPVVVDKLEAPELRDRIAESAMSVAFTGPEQFPALIRDTANAYGKVIKSAGVQLD